MMKLTIRKKVLFCSLIPLLLLGGIILLIASTIVKGAIIDQVENSLKGTAIATQAAYDQNAGTRRKMVISGKEVITFHSQRIWWIPSNRSLGWM